jgi:hypothetical protein
MLDDEKVIYSLGRRPAPDDRDADYPVARLLSERAPKLPKTRYWNANAYWGNQKTHPHCVGYAWTHWLKAGPNTQRAHQPDPRAVYFEAQKVDEFRGENYEGTSVRAGAKVLQGRGLIESYWWAGDVEQVAEAVLGVGPVVVGTTWFYNMNVPDPAEKFRLRPIGEELGGHAYLLDGYNSKTRVFRVKNSWSRAWADQGHARLHADDLAVLLDADGEACLAVETTPEAG